MNPAYGLVGNREYFALLAGHGAPPPMQHNADKVGTLSRKRSANVRLLARRRSEQARTEEHAVGCPESQSTSSSVTLNCTSLGAPSQPCGNGIFKRM